MADNKSWDMQQAERCREPTIAVPAAEFHKLLDELTRVGETARHLQHGIEPAPEPFDYLGRFMRWLVHSGPSFVHEHKRIVIDFPDDIASQAACRDLVAAYAQAKAKANP